MDSLFGNDKTLTDLSGTHGSVGLLADASCLLVSISSFRSSLFSASFWVVECLCLFVGKVRRFSGAPKCRSMDALVIPMDLLGWLAPERLGRRAAMMCSLP